MHEDKRKTTQWSRTTWAARIAVLIVLACLIVGQGGRWSTQADLANAALVFAIPAIAVLLLVLARLRDRAGLALLVLAALFAGERITAASAGMARQTAAAASDGTVSVLTLNLYHANARPKAAAAVIASAKADLVVLQEADGSGGAMIATLLPGYYRLHSCSRPPCSLAILSRWPIWQMPPWRSRKTRKSADMLTVVVEGPHRQFLVSAIHLPRPSQQPQSRLLREAAVETIGTLPQLPLILAGDFNLTPGTFALSSLERATGLRRSNGWLATYPANTALPALLPIDHVYVDRTWAPRGCRRLPDTGSDHRGLLCRLAPITPSR